MPAIYREKIRALRTRSIALDIPEKENAAEILHTLLGIELRVGRQRYSCPDLATARYMLVFARLGCREFAIPYDITRISTLADELETAWQRTRLLLEANPRGPAARVKSRLLKAIRLELLEIGPGERMPEFRQSTKQRPS